LHVLQTFILTHKPVPFKFNMANSARNTPGVERPTSQEIDMNPLDSIQASYEKNKTMISYVLTAVVVIVGGYLAYTKLYKGPNEEKAFTKLAIPQMYFQADSMSMALKGDGKNMGLEKIAKNYEGTAGGNLALYYEGVAYLKTGDFKGAVKALSAFDGKGTVLGNQASGLLGMAYMEMGDKKNAIEAFKKATSNKEDGLVTPLYLYHLGLAYEADGKTNEAKEAFKRVRDEYPRSVNARDMDKELARLGELN